MNENETTNVVEQQEVKSYKYIYGVSFKKALQTYFFGSDEKHIKLHEKVIVETSRGLELGSIKTKAKTLKEVKDVDGMGLDIKEKFTSITVQISGKNKGEDTTTYTLWYFENADGFKKTTMNVTFN